MGGAFHDFNSNIVTVLEVFSKPDCREVTPPEFLDQHIPVDQDLTNMTRMISSNFVVFDSLIFTVILFVEVGNQFLKGTGSNR